MSKQNDNNEVAEETIAEIPATMFENMSATRSHSQISPSQNPLDNSSLLTAPAAGRNDMYPCTNRFNRDSELFIKIINKNQPNPSRASYA